MSQTSKLSPSVHSGNVMAAIYNPEDKSITTSSFLTAKVGHKVEKVNFSPTVEDYSFYDGATLLYTLRVTYADTAKSEFVSAERTA